MSKAAELAALIGSQTALSNRNLIINGACVIDQRNGGSSITPIDGQYSVDRWRCALNQASKFTIQQSTVTPDDFLNSLLVTSSSAYTIGASDLFLIEQRVEGLNSSQLNWGTSSAKSITLSFWVRSSLTGTFGGSVRNSDNTRSHPFSYTISSANTFEYKSVTISGDTSGTWLTTNGVGLQITFGLGVGSSLSGTAGAWAGTSYLSATGATSLVGTSGATLYITGVQLEVGETATPFEHRSYGEELALCQRYYFSFPNANYNIHAADYNNSLSITHYEFPVTMRTLPTMSITNGAGTSTSTGVSPEGFHHVFSTVHGNFVSDFTASAEL